LSQAFRVLDHIATDFQRLPYILVVRLFLVFVLPMSWDVDVCHAEIQDGNQITGGSPNVWNIAWMANVRHSTIANSQEAYLGVSNNDRRLKWRPKPEILISLKL